MKENPDWNEELSPLTLKEIRSTTTTMRNPDSLTFAGNYLRVVGTPQLEGNTLRIELAGNQRNQEFLDRCKEDPTGIKVATRRLLLAHGIILEQREVTMEGEQLRVQAQLRQLQNGMHDALLASLKGGMYLARPYHFNGRKPISADRAAFAVAQGFLPMSRKHQRELPEQDDANVFSASGTAGYLKYYPEATDEQRRALIENRLFVRPGNTDGLSRPVWEPHQRGLLRAGQFVAQKVDRIRNRFHTIVIRPQGIAQESFVDPGHNSFIAFDVNGDRPVDVRDVPPVQYSLVDNRGDHLIAPDDLSQRASVVLTESYAAADEFLLRLEGADDSRPSALILNADGIRAIRDGESSWRKDSSKPDPAQRQIKGTRELRTTFAPHLSPVSLDALLAAELALLRQSAARGMDAGAVLATDTLPPHAVFKSLLEADITQGRRPFTTLLFRRPSLHHGPFFSGPDYHALQDCCDKGIDVYWANDTMPDRNGEGPGALLQLTNLSRGQSRSLAFIPPNRREEYLRGNHIAFYGTARTLKPEYIQFMEELFKEMDKLRNGNHLVIHSGGGPNHSTMGNANRLAQLQRFMSIGHVLGVDKEPPNQYLDGLMTFRNPQRGVRQLNMAAAVTGGVIVVEGGGGTLEELGISLVDVAILTDPYPIILIGGEFYEHQYMQLLQATSQGVLDDHVLQCVSLLDVHQAHQAAQILDEFARKKRLRSCIPNKFTSMRQRAIESFQQISPERKRAWAKHQ